jgi:uncharacterized protein
MFSFIQKNGNISKLNIQTEEQLMLRGRESENVEDRRGMSGKTVALGGGGCFTFILIIAAVLLGGDPSALLQQSSQQDVPAVQNNTQQQNDEQIKNVKTILGSTEDAWREIFRKNGGSYRDPKLIVFDGQTASACGRASSSTGPFYCPGDDSLYLDMAFFRELKTEFKAPGDFAQAYVIAHEVGHHIQNLVGTMNKVTALQNRSSEADSNRLSVRLELQADCYAGVWGNSVSKKGQLEVGDLEEAIRAAAGVGDDMIQKRTQGYVVPESFTHGSAKDRATWFMTGFKSGDLRQCNSFAGIRGM